MLLPLVPHVRRYAWAHPLAMASFVVDGLPGGLGDPPVAELWFGTHPTGTALVRTPGGERPLADLVGDLPWMLKVLAIGASLSLQVHPDVALARRDHARGLLPDDRAKPEMLLAISAVRALAGIRPDAGDGRSVADLLRLGPAETRQRVAQAAAVVGPSGELARTLAARYPDDPAVLAALRLHDLRLDPGAALFVPPGLPHVYLEGLAIELMASSDNVVRGGLSPKSVDAEAFLEALDGRPGPPPLLEPAVDGADDATVRRFRPPACGFELAVVEVDGRADLPIRPPAIVLVVDGQVAGLARGTAALTRDDGQSLDGHGLIVVAQSSQPG